jgi:hypothetical protein
MAGFDFFSCRINVADRGSSVDLAAMPGNAIMTMSFSHEYIHYLQLISSNSGFRILAELVDFGVHSALQLAGDIPVSGGEIRGYHEILPKLAALPDHEGQNHSDIRARTRDFMDEARLMFLPIDFPYAGPNGPWSIDQQEVTNGSYTEPMAGFVTPNKRFRAFTPGLLAESMARRIDQWLKAQMGYNAHTWHPSVEETEVYNGIKNILSQPRYEHNVFPVTIDRVTVIVCSLALATPRPDHAVFRMLQRLEYRATAGGLSETIGHELRRVLIEEGLLHANHYNEVMNGIMLGPARVMNRVEYMAIHRQLERIHSAGAKAMASPGFLADDGMNWDRMKALMVEHTVPPVRASDGDVAAVVGVPCVSNVTAFLEMVARKLF